MMCIIFFIILVALQFAGNATPPNVYLTSFTWKFYRAALAVIEGLGIRNEAIEVTSARAIVTFPDMQSSLGTRRHV